MNTGVTTAPIKGAGKTGIGTTEAARWMINAGLNREMMIAGTMASMMAVMIAGTMVSTMVAMMTVMMVAGETKIHLALIAVPLPWRGDGFLF